MGQNSGGATTGTQPTSNPTSKTGNLSAVASKIRTGTDKVKLAKKTVKDKTGYAKVEAMGKDLADIKKAMGELQAELSKPKESGGIFWPAVGLTAGCLTVIVLADIYAGMRAVAKAVDKIPGVELGLVDDGVQPSSKPTTNTPAKVGDVIGGYPVTSGYGPRQSPCPGCSTYHAAVDLGTPRGTPVHAPYAAKVECRFNKPSGNIAHIKPVSGDAPEFLALHLQQCWAGKRDAGELVALTGNTGNGTGPHLDWREMSKGEYVHPAKEWIAIALTGNVPDDKTVTLIKDLESFHPTPYWDRQQYSWGYGTKARGATGSITKDEALAELTGYLETHCYPLTGPLELSGHQAAAINSFCYNVGPEQFKGSKVYAHLRTGDTLAAAEELSRWTKSNGEELPGLISRRAKEKALFLDGGA
ncbi:MAG: peptidoglycan DD-metalloendopeptidase family protein [Cyanobacteria bacterium J06656_5]